MLLTNHKSLFVDQSHELSELYGFEARNKYKIYGSDRYILAYAAEQEKSWLAFIGRQFFGHWRRFEVGFYIAGEEQLLYLRCIHPFRWYFSRLEVMNASGYVGAIQRRFSLLSKSFIVKNAAGNVILEVISPIWKIWTFRFMSGEQQRASV